MPILRWNVAEKEINSGKLRDATEITYTACEGLTIAGISPPIPQTISTNQSVTVTTNK